MNTYRIHFRGPQFNSAGQLSDFQDVEADKMEICEGVKFYQGKLAFLFYPLDLILYVKRLTMPEGGKQSRRGIKDPDAPDGEPRIVSPVSDDLKAQVDAVEKAGKDGIGKEF